ncbi:MAG: hypothetical protein LBT00_10365 [Spirochaetaceae bacterium]|nr:hypothetical protein [Spirochaetaceae bacterium]
MRIGNRDGGRCGGVGRNDALSLRGAKRRGNLVDGRGPLDCRATLAMTRGVGRSDGALSLRGAWRAIVIANPQGEAI